MKRISTQLQITSNNQKLYTVTYTTYEQDMQLVIEALTNYLQILYENEHIKLTADNVQYLGNNTYSFWYIEPIETLTQNEIELFAALLAKAFHYNFDQAHAITLANLTPIQEAIKNPKYAYIYYNTDDYLMQTTHPYEDCESIQIPWNENTIITIYPD